MKSLKILTGIAVATIGISAAVVTGVVNHRNNITAANAETFVYNASNVTKRRIYFVNNDKGGYWYQGWALEAQVWYGETYSGFVSTHEIYGNYYYYVDFESSVTGFLGGDLHIQFRVLDGEYKYTSWAYNIPSLNQKKFDVVFIDNGNPVVGSAVDIGENTSIIGSVLDHYQTCVADYASGYYGYPQLYKDFIEQNQTAIDTHGDTTYVADKDDEENNYNIKQKIAKLESLYTTNGWTVA